MDNAISYYENSKDIQCTLDSQKKQQYCPLYLPDLSIQFPNPVHLVTQPEGLAGSFLLKFFIVAIYRYFLATARPRLVRNVCPRPKLPSVWR